MCILPIGFVLPFTAFKWEYAIRFDIENDNQVLGLFNSFPAIFAILGAPILGLVNRYFGRKIGVVVVTLFYMIGWIFIIFATKKSLVALFYLGRLFGGLGVGASCAVVPPYITEISSPENRGPYGTLSQLFISFGFAITYAASCNVASCEAKNIRDVELFSFTFQHAAIMFLVFNAVVLVLFWFFVPPPPSGGVNETDPEEKEQDSLFQKKYIIPFITGVLPLVFQQFSGINTFLSNLNSIFSDAGVTLNTGVVSIFVTLSQSVTTLMTAPVLKYLGRRWAWNISAGGQAIFLLLGCINVFFIKNESVLPVLCLFFDCFFYGLALGPLPFAVMSEIIPDSVRTSAVAIGQVINWIFAAATMYARDGIGGDDGYYFLFFGVCNLIGVLYGFTLLPNDVIAKRVEEA